MKTIREALWWWLWCRGPNLELMCEAAEGSRIARDACDALWRWDASRGCPLCAQSKADAERLR